MLDVPTLVFMRHGETDWNRSGRLQGQQDIPLNDLGREQAHRNGAAALREIPDIAGYDFVASPLHRTRETMEIARRAMGLAPDGYAMDDRLKEVSFGDWERHTTDEVRARDPEGVAAREADKWRFRPPGGESYEELCRRVEPWLSALRRPTVLVAHGGVGRILRIKLLGDEPLAAMAVNVDQNSFMLWRDGQGRFI